MIRSFGDEETKQLFLTGKSRRFANIAKVALRRVEAIDFAVSIEDLKNPPGNHLEKLRRDRADQYSIRINDQFRVCFRWDKGAWDVQIVDYH